MRSPLLLLLAWLVPLVAARAEAQERPLAEALVVEADDPCLDPARLAAQVGAWLERDHIAPELGVVVRGGPSDPSFELTRGGEVIATRHFDRAPADCADRRTALALAIALALDAAILESIGIAAPAPAPTAPEPAPDAAPPPEPVPETEVKLPPRPPAGERPAFALEGEAWLALELLPDPALGGLLAFAWLPGEGVRLRLGALATQLVGAAVGPGGADVALVAGRLDGCVDRTVLPRLLLGGCIGAMAGALLASGRELPVVEDATLPWGGAIVRAELRWVPVDPLALTVGAEGLLAFVQPRLDIEDRAGAVIASRSLSTAGLAVVLGAAWMIE